MANVPPELVALGVILGVAVNVGAILRFSYNIGGLCEKILGRLDSLTEKVSEQGVEVKQTRIELRVHTDAEEVIFREQKVWNANREGELRELRQLTGKHAR